MKKLELALAGLLLSGCSFSLEREYRPPREEYQKSDQYGESTTVSPIFVIRFDKKEEATRLKNYEK